jgi:hypothetical protein
MSLYIRWPEGEEDQPDAYLAAATAHVRTLMNDPTVNWAPPQPYDRFGRRVAPYLGPGGFIWNGEPYPEPAECLAERTLGVLTANPYFPDPEEG